MIYGLIPCAIMWEGKGDIDGPMERLEGIVPLLIALILDFVCAKTLWYLCRHVRNISKRHRSEYALECPPSQTSILPLMMMDSSETLRVDRGGSRQPNGAGSS